MAQKPTESRYPMIRIALFADIHGKFLLPFKLADRYQQETGEQIDLILQCGDLGAFPSLNNLDKATIRHARNDRDELGFADQFVTRDPTIATYLENLNLDMICIRGNHEDHDFLDELEAASDATRFSIDAYQRVWVCKTGMLQTVQVRDEMLCFAGIGRVGDRKGRNDKKFIQDYERKALKKLIKSKVDLDVLITHDKADKLEPGYGMPEISQLLDELIVHYHFYGHTGEPYKQETAANGITQSVKIKELEFEESAALPACSMVILEKHGPAKFNLKVVPQKITNPLNKYSWKLV